MEALFPGLTDKSQAVDRYNTIEAQDPGLMILQEAIRPTISIFETVETLGQGQRLAQQLGA